jgi:hypothetical protein
MFLRHIAREFNKCKQLLENYLKELRENIMENKEQKIFISFASQERELALQLKKLIEEKFKSQVKVFVSDTTITAGEIWENEIKDNIKDATLVLVLCSQLSIQRQWVNFECGAAAFREVPIIPLCHSGLRWNDLIPFAGWQEVEAIDVHGPGFFGKVVKAVDAKPKINTQPDLKIIPIVKDELDKKISVMVQRLDKTEEDKKKEDEKNGKWPPKYLLVTARKNDDFIEIGTTGISDPIGGPMKSESGWLCQMREMHDFLTRGDVKYIGCTGLAIGIQNCLFDGTNIYVGVRMKSIADAYSSSVGVAKGKFNTGYELLRERGGRKFKAIDTLQDLFVTMPEHIKQFVQPDTEIYKKMEERVSAVGAKLWRIRFGDEREGIATIFVNNSGWFPRFEIGVWKFIDISAAKLGKARDTLDKQGIIDGFGEDVFLDYRGRENVEDTPVNYWIWVKDGEIYYWSFPEERLIPRKKPVKYSAPMHAVLVRTQHMIAAYNNLEKYTPFASDENLSKPNAVLTDQFSLPARALLSCF